MGDTFTKVTIESLANSGEGVGRVDGKVVFVPYSCPGDILEALVTTNKKKFARANIKKLLNPSPHRVPPRCPHFSVCGGCDWQHIDYETQLFWKKQNLAQSLKRIGGIEKLPEIKIKGCSETYNYRNRIQVQFESGKFSFAKRASNQRIPIEKCDIADERINIALAQIKAHLTNQGIANQRVELAIVDNQVEVFLHDGDLSSGLGFRQVNDEQNQYLVQKIVSLVEALQVDQLVDLYCGSGNWMFAINDHLPHIQCLGVDLNPINIQRGRAYDRPNVEFQLGHSEIIYPQLSGQWPVVILDPPRSGCHPDLLKKLCEKPPKHLIYISCDPATLARDLKALLSGPFSLTDIEAIDMFPQTRHCEAWVLLQGGTPSNTD
ncbi:MAG: class I SAM-dependent RNA methyltransferase [Bdellovibrionales bacterium]|nr:class I SAM-dependent RNA methyltransferase [Bdellovibrionales bacterium]